VKQVSFTVNGPTLSSGRISVEYLAQTWGFENIPVNFILHVVTENSDKSFSIIAGRHGPAAVHIHRMDLLSIYRPVHDAAPSQKGPGKTQDRTAVDEIYADSAETNTMRYCGWLGSRVVSVLDSSVEGPGFKSQPRRCRVTVLGKLFTPIVPLFTKQQN